MRILAAALCALLLLPALTAEKAQAQTRISLDAGLLMPLGDMADVNDTSPMVGFRWEQQETNALGNVATRTWFLRFGYGILQTDSAVPDDVSDGHYLEAKIGGRAYAQSTKSPFFMSVAGGYAHYQLPGPGDGLHGGTISGGLGLRLPLAGFIFEAEFRGHVGFFEESTNIQFLSGIVSLGIPL